MSSRIISFRPAAQPWHAPLQCRRRRSSGCLLSRLQSSLNPEELLQVYWDELQQLLGADGLSWRHEALSMQLDFGAPTRQLRAYELLLGGESLGELSVSRRAPLQTTEGLLLEQTLDLLIQPLNNAVLYQQALAAARQDQLTGLGNRVAFDEALSMELELASRHGTPFSLLLIDIDRFKHINDHHGHLAGDQVLTGVAQTLQAQARQSDSLFRYAGDEFVILMRQTDRAGAYAVANRIRSAVEQQAFHYGSELISAQLSIGCATAGAGEEASALFNRADQALLLAKRSGRNQISWASCPDERSRRLLA